jgi:hypothetical protein
VEFCERLESAEDYTDVIPSGKKDSKSNKKPKHTSGGKGKHGDKWCEYHESNTHNTSECSVIKKLKDSGSKKSTDRKSGNKTWTRKSDDAKAQSKKELNALVKQVTQKVTSKVKKDMKQAAKRKAAEKEEESDENSINLVEQMEDIDKQLKEFNFEEALDTSIEV